MSQAPYKLCLRLSHSWPSPITEKGSKWFCCCCAVRPCHPHPLCVSLLSVFRQRRHLMHQPSLRSIPHDHGWICERSQAGHPEEANLHLHDDLPETCSWNVDGCQGHTGKGGSLHTLDMHSGGDACLSPFVACIVISVQTWTWLFRQACSVEKLGQMSHSAMHLSHLQAHNCRLLYMHRELRCN